MPSHVRRRGTSPRHSAPLHPWIPASRRRDNISAPPKSAIFYELRRTGSYRRLLERVDARRGTAARTPRECIAPARLCNGLGKTDPRRAPRVTAMTPSGRDLQSSGPTKKTESTRSGSSIALAQKGWIDRGPSQRMATDAALEATAASRKRNSGANPQTQGELGRGNSHATVGSLHALSLTRWRV